MKIEDRLKETFRAAGGRERATGAEWNDFTRRAHRSLFIRRGAVSVGAASIVVGAAIGAFALNSNGPGQPVDVAPAPKEREGVAIEESAQEVWYVRDGRLSVGSILMGGTLRPGIEVPDDPVAQKAAFWLDELLGPIQPAAAEVGETTAIPEGTELLGVSLEGSVLDVDLSTEFGRTSGSEADKLARGQIVFTATQFEGVDSVRINVAGTGPSLDGRPLPDGRADLRYREVAPPIILLSPKPNQTIGHNYVVRGIANISESKIQVGLSDGHGKDFSPDEVSLACGTNCWGEFESMLDFDVTKPTKLFLFLVSESANGSMHHEVAIPVTLYP